MVQFLEFIDGINTMNSPVMVSKQEFIPIIDKYFPEANLSQMLKALDASNQINKRLSENFNGRIVMEWIPGLYGAELGNTIRKFKETLGENYETVVLLKSKDELKKIFMKFYGKK